LYFDNFGDYPNILPMYLSGIGVLLFGNHEFGMRVPIALFGILGVYLVYLISKLLFAKKSLALFAALTLAVFPWHIVLSRATAEGVTAASVFLLGLYLFLRHLKSNYWLTLFGAYLAWFLTYLLYPSYRLVIPLVLLPTLLMSKHKTNKIIYLSVALVSLLITFLISQTTWGTGRFAQTSLFSQESQVYALQAEFIAGEGHQNALKAHLFYNKALMFGKEFIKQYTSYFSFDFLFAKGGLPMRYFVPDQGLWYYSYFALFLMVLIGAITQNKFVTKSMNKLLDNPWQKSVFIILFIYFYSRRCQRR
jgi:4-amino-4-deoxy-L-arabinose transferase-like glycosyltransferase